MQSVRTEDDDAKKKNTEEESPRSVVFAHINEFEAYDSSYDSSYHPIVESDIDTDDDDLSDEYMMEYYETIYQDFALKTVGTTTKRDNGAENRDLEAVKLSSSQEDQIPSEPEAEFDYAEDSECIEEIMSDEDGENEELFECRARFRDEHEYSAQDAIRQECQGQTTVAHGVTWKVKTDIMELNRQEDDMHYEAMKMPEGKAWDNSYSPLFFFEKCFPVKL